MQIFIDSIISYYKHFIRWALHTEASSRSSALIRIGLVLLIWARWAEEVAVFNASSVGDVMLAVNFFAATTLMLIGFFSRAATMWTALSLACMYYYGGFVLGIEPWTHHHTYLLMVSTFLCAFSPCEKSYSLDRFFAIRKAVKTQKPIPAESGNIWALRLIAIQLSALYFWSAFDKTSLTFLTGERLEAIFMYYLFGSYPTLPFFHELMVLLSILVLVIEYSLAFGLLFRATQKRLIVPGLIFHGILYFFLPVRTFSASMWLLYLAYIPPNTVHMYIDEIQKTDENCPKSIT